jgi:hypothetical protein
MLSAESGDFILPQLLGVRRIGDQIYMLRFTRVYYLLASYVSQAIWLKIVVSNNRRRKLIYHCRLDNKSVVIHYHYSFQSNRQF